MAGIALDGAPINDSTVSRHIRYRRWEYQYTTPIEYDDEGNPIGGGEDIYDWEYYRRDATVKGSCEASSSSVFVNGKNAILEGDNTIENDSYSIPVGAEYYDGSHRNASGVVNVGNGSSVYINGKSVAIAGSTVTTHAETSTTISEGSSNVQIG